MTKQRLKSIKIAVTDEELEQLKSLCPKPRLAEWMRETCLGQTPKKPTPKTDPELLRQLAGIGNNLNQVARWLNRSPSITAQERVELLAYLVALERGINGDR